MTLNEQGYAVLELPAAPPELLDTYDDLPVDAYMGGGTRYKRFSQYKLSWSAEAGWALEVLPHRDYTTYKKFNPVGGGIRRVYQPLKADFSDYVRAAADGFPLSRSEAWQINVHQNRTRATADRPGPLTPEGVHKDGHEYVLIAVLRRVNVAGAETRLWQPDAEAPFWSGVLDAGRAVLIDDQAIAHDVTDVRSADGGPAYRDIVIVAFSRWQERWYGDEHDAAALAEQTD
ncbi:MAG: 2OG-Fe dioxygenase family protein [Mycobacteriales bacterium]